MLPAASSMRALSPSGRRREIRAVVSSASNVAVGGGGGGAGGSAGNRGGDDELRIAAAQAHLDRSGGELGRDLLGGRPEGVDEHEADGGVEGGEQAVGGPAHVVAGDLGGGGELAVEGVDVGCQLHDVSMTSS